MKFLRSFALFAPFCLLAPAHAAELDPLANHQRLAGEHHLVLALPAYPKSAAEVRSKTEQALQQADAALAGLVGSRPQSFEQTFAAYDAITGDVGTFAGQIELVAETSPDSAMRDAAREMAVKIEDWGIALDYREDLYRVLKGFADAAPKLDPQQQRLADFTLRSYRRAGLALPAAERQQVEKLRKELSATEQIFSVNINQARGPVDLTAEELAGTPASLRESPGIRQSDGRFRVMANVTWQTVAVLENAVNPETRRKVYLVRNSLAKDTNVAVLKKLVELRAEIAHRLGYGSWADYRTETRMAKDGATAVKFENDLVAGLQPKFAAEMETLRQLKAAETHEPAARIEPWDVAYYMNQLKKQRYAVDAEQLRVFFPYQPVLEGMFRIYQRIFALKFTQVEPPAVWTPGVQLWVVADATTGVPMGSFYLDMFPREGKFNHFACFPQNPGRVLPDGRYELPVAALVCNFPPASADKPSLLSHTEVQTLFHEFGHVMHTLLSRARYQEQTSAGVPRDFVEAPSQMLENWVWDKAVLDTFAADYRDPARKIPAETIAALTEARKATDGYLNRRQLSLGLADLALHTCSPAEAAGMDVLEATNAVLGRVTVPPAPGTAFVAYFGHLAGYDAGYYGYLWAKVMAIDMASEFERAPGRYLDESVGRRLRDEVYAAGDTRDVAVSVERFLGRPRSTQPFLEYVGIRGEPAAAK